MLRKRIHCKINSNKVKIYKDIKYSISNYHQKSNHTPEVIDVPALIAPIP